jgi:cell fate regulator YaaT (PSP1 superfamily)
VRIVKLQFQAAGKLYDFSAGSLDLAHGDIVVVETERGKSLATVVVPPVEIADESVPAGIKQVIRRAEPHDHEAAHRNQAREREAFRYCMNRIKDRGMDMKLVKVNYVFDGSKAIFYFTADGRIDFRELVKDLAHAFHTRIEMRQIGVRDEAKMVGGCGICGRELCCSSFLRDFAPVSVKMAKEQSLALNPTKISGQCGRLLCCLGYEYETYCDLKKGLPKCGKRLCLPQNEGEVVKQNIFAGTVTVRTDDGQEMTVAREDIRPDQVFDKAKKPAGREQGQEGGKAAPAEGRPDAGGRPGKEGRQAKEKRPRTDNRPSQKESEPQTAAPAAEPKEQRSRQRNRRKNRGERQDASNPSPKNEDTP